MTRRKRHPPVRTTVAEARRLAEAENFAEALDLLDPIVKYKTAQVFLRWIREVIKEKVEKAQADLIESSLKAARLAIERKQWRQAERVLTQILEMDSDHQEALQLLEKVLEEGGAVWPIEGQVEPTLDAARAAMVLIDRIDALLLKDERFEPRGELAGFEPGVEPDQIEEDHAYDQVQEPLIEQQYDETPESRPAREDTESSPDDRAKVTDSLVRQRDIVVDESKTETFDSEAEEPRLNVSDPMELEIQEAPAPAQELLEKATSQPVHQHTLGPTDKVTGRLPSSDPVLPNTSPRKAAQVRGPGPLGASGVGGTPAPQTSQRAPIRLGRTARFPGMSKRRSSHWVWILLLPVVAFCLWLWSPPPSAPEEIAIQVEIAPSENNLEIWIDKEDVNQSTPSVVPLKGKNGETVLVELRRTGGGTVANTRWTIGKDIPVSWKPTIRSVPVPPPPPPQPQPQPVTVRSQPTGARILLDDNTVEATPGTISIFPGQTYRLQITLGGYRSVSRSLSWDQLTEGEKKGGLMFQLQPLEPPGKIVVDGDYLVSLFVGGVDRKRPRVLELPPGRYEIRAEAREVYFSKTYSVELKSGEEFSLPLPFLVNTQISARPPNCKVVRIDSFTVELDLPASLSIVAGQHHFELEWPGLGRRLPDKVILVSPKNPVIDIVLPNL